MNSPAARPRCPNWPSCCRFSARRFRNKIETSTIRVRAFLGRTYCAAFRKVSAFFLGPRCFRLPDRQSGLRTALISASDKRMRRSSCDRARVPPPHSPTSGAMQLSSTIRGSLSSGKLHPKFLRAFFRYRCLSASWAFRASMRFDASALVSSSSKRVRTMRLLRKGLQAGGLRPAHRIVARDPVIGVLFCVGRRVRVDLGIVVGQTEPIGAGRLRDLA